MTPISLYSARILIVLNFRPHFMPQPSPVGIRDADRPEQVFQPPGDHTEYGDLEFVSPECLPTVREYLGPGWSVGGLGCNEPCDYREFRPYVNQHPYATLIADLVDHTGFVVGKHIGV